MTAERPLFGTMPQLQLEAVFQSPPPVPDQVVDVPIVSTAAELVAAGEQVPDTTTSKLPASVDTNPEIV